MNRKPSRAFVICIVPLLATAAAGAWVWQKANSAPLHIRARSTFLELLRYEEKPAFAMPTPEERAKTLQATQDMIEQMTGEFPALRITEHPVPDDQNAFLLLHQLAGPLVKPGPPLSREFKKLLSNEIPWDAAIATRCLEEHAALVSEIEHIASLTTRSSANMPDDYHGFISARTAKHCAETLLVKARLAAEAKDEKETLRLLTGTGSLASHFRVIETRTLLAETVAILIDLSIRKATFEHLLPALGRDADLAQWKSALSSRRGYTPADFADIIRGEWNVSSRYILLPFILREGHPDTPPDAEALIRAYSSRFNDDVTQLPGMSLATLLKSGFHTESGTAPKLSKRSQEIMNTLLIGSRSWAKGYCQYACVRAQYQAVLDLMILEQSGEILAADTTSMTTLDPITGSPFVFDPVTREVSLPADSGNEIEVEPIRLPF